MNHLDPEGSTANRSAFHPGTGSGIEAIVPGPGAAETQVPMTPSVLPAYPDRRPGSGQSGSRGNSAARRPNGPVDDEHQDHDEENRKNDADDDVRRGRSAAEIALAVGRALHAERGRQYARDHLGQGGFGTLWLGHGIGLKF
ncbi:protein of unknown function [Candidatus Methylocalor cossyra]|uniref:Protein kinase domain-containing protein n=1 Tax=Candidatus Methylocalor cossyra TaxID=3108543 RepID=A0ABM9NG56_9GAMM